MTPSTDFTPSVRFGSAAVCLLALVGLGAAVGLTIAPPHAATPVLASSAPAATFPAWMMGLLVVCQGLAVFACVAVVVGFISDVRRRGKIRSISIPVDPALRDAFDRLEGSTGVAAAESLADSIASLTSATRTEVYEVDAATLSARSVATAGGPEQPGSAIDLVGLIEASTPRRWVEVDDESAWAVMTAPVLRDGMVVGVVVAFRESEHPFSLRDLDVMCQLVLVLSSTVGLIDETTNLPNRRRFDHDLNSTLGTGDAAVGLAIVDVDHLPLHLRDESDDARSALLSEVSSVLAGAAREGDVVYSWGGGRFGVLVSGADDAQTAEVAERLRRAIEVHRFEGASTSAGCRLTVSVGTAVTDAADSATADALAEGALDLARNGGGNRVVASSAA